MNTNWQLPEPLSEETLAQMGENLIDEIRNAFASVSISGGVTLTEAYAIDNYEDEEVRAKARVQDTYTDWTKIDVCRLDPGQSAMSFMDPIGFRFHLPAYMCFAIKQISMQQISGYIDLERLLPDFQIANDHGKRMTAQFDQAQFAACTRFLVYLAEEQYTREFEFSDDMDRLAKDIYDDMSPLRIMRIAWWGVLSEEERQALRVRWPVLQDVPY